MFKGGTSLSKVFGKIQRFSEDIDLAIDRSHFGLKGDLTKKQLKKLRKASSTFVRDVMLKDLELTLTKYGVKDIDIVAEPDGEGDSTYPDPRKIHIEYESLFKESLNYIKPRVMLEIGARSLTEPFIMSRITSLVSEVIPDLHTNIVDVDIPTAAIEKTFLEKAFLLHELFSTEAGNMANRKSRHLYDLERMMDEPFAIEVINNSELWESIRHNREVFTSIRGLNYGTDIRREIILIPPEKYMDEWKNDYEAMRGSMIFGDSLSFDSLMERMEILQNRFHEYH